MVLPSATRDQVVASQRPWCRDYADAGSTLLYYCTWMYRLVSDFETFDT